MTRSSHHDVSTYLNLIATRVPASPASWPGSCRNSSREDRLQDPREISSLSSRPSLSARPFKTHSVGVPNGFLQVAVSKTLRRLRFLHPRSPVAPDNFR